MCFPLVATVRGQMNVHIFFLKVKVCQELNTFLQVYETVSKNAYLPHGFSEFLHFNQKKPLNRN